MIMTNATFNIATTLNKDEVRQTGGLDVLLSAYSHVVDKILH